MTLAILRDENLDEYARERYWDFVKQEYLKALKDQDRAALSLPEITSGVSAAKQAREQTY